MRRILVLVFVLLSIQGFAQPSNYSWYKQRTRQYSFMADSAMYLPRYNGTPSGVRSNESSTISGMVGIDTTNHRQYFRSGSSWRRLANYTELGVDSIWRVAGTDSIYYSKQGTTYKIKDSTGGSSSVPLSSLTAATAANTIDNGAHRQEWQWNSLTTGAGLTLSSSSIESGSILRVIGTHNNNVSDSGLIYVYSQGIPPSSGVTSYGIRSKLFRAGTNSTNIAGMFEASNGSFNYALIVPSGGGSVGIGTSSPAASAITEISSTTKGVLFPRMTAAQRGAIGSPSTGLFVWDSDSARYMAYNGSAWKGLKYTDEGGGGGATSPAGNFGNLQINRNGAFATPGSDSLDFESETGLTVKNDINVSGTGKAFIGRWKARVDSTTSSATPTINTDNIDIYKLTAQAADITSFTTNLSGTPYDGDILEIVITGTATRAITWGTSFVSTTVTLPTTTSSTTTLTVILQYFKSSSYGNNKWHCVNYF